MYPGTFLAEELLEKGDNHFVPSQVLIFMLLLSRNYVFRVDPITRDYSGPAERVRLVTCRLTFDYPAKEYHN